MKLYGSSSAYLDKTLNFIVKRKCTISQRKLKVIHDLPFPIKERDVEAFFLIKVQILISNICSLTSIKKLANT